MSRKSCKVWKQKPLNVLDSYTMSEFTPYTISEFTRSMLVLRLSRKWLGRGVKEF